MGDRRGEGKYWGKRLRSVTCMYEYGNNESQYYVYYNTNEN